MLGPDKSTLNLAAASTTLVEDCTKLGYPGKVYVVHVTTAGSAPGAVYDTNDTSASGTVAANLIGVLPNTVGPVNFYGFPYQKGLVVVTGTGQVASVAYH